MSQDRVKLPKEVAETIEYYRDNFDQPELFIMKVATEDSKYIGDPDYCQVIKDYVKSNDNLKTLMQALVNDYKVETPEDKVRELYDRYSESDDRKYRGMAIGIKETLNALNIKIEGVNT